MASSTASRSPPTTSSSVLASCAHATSEGFRTSTPPSAVSAAARSSSVPLRSIVRRASRALAPPLDASASAARSRTSGAPSVSRGRMDSSASVGPSASSASRAASLICRSRDATKPLIAVDARGAPVLPSSSSAWTSSRVARILLSAAATRGSTARPSGWPASRSARVAANASARIAGFALPTNSRTVGRSCGVPAFASARSAAAVGRVPRRRAATISGLAAVARSAPRTHAALVVAGAAAPPRSALRRASTTGPEGSPAPPTLATSASRNGVGPSSPLASSSRPRRPTRICSAPSAPPRASMPSVARAACRTAALRSVTDGEMESTAPAP